MHPPFPDMGFYEQAEDKAELAQLMLWTINTSLFFVGVYFRFFLAKKEEEGINDKLFKEVSGFLNEVHFNNLPEIAEITYFDYTLTTFDSNQWVIVTFKTARYVQLSEQLDSSESEFIDQDLFLKIDIARKIQKISYDKMHELRLVDTRYSSSTGNHVFKSKLIYTRYRGILIVIVDGCAET